MSIITPRSAVSLTVAHPVTLTPDRPVLVRSHTRRRNTNRRTAAARSAEYQTRRAALSERMAGILDNMGADITANPAMLSVILTAYRARFIGAAL